MVSIILPCYNAEKYLTESINSILSQTYKDWELIIINDGSIDDSDKIIRGFRDPRIRYFSKNKNTGVSAARNVGLRNMLGDFFCFLDADDFLPPESLENRIKKVEINPELDFLDGKVEIYDQNLKRKIDYWLPTYQGNPLLPLLNISKLSRQ